MRSDCSSTCQTSGSSSLEVKHKNRRHEAKAEDCAEKSCRQAPLTLGFGRPKRGLMPSEILPHHDEINRYAHQQNYKELQRISVGLPKDRNQPNLDNQRG